jgi:hypothetical protein
MATFLFFCPSFDLHAMHLKHLFDALYVVHRFCKMFFEALLEFGRRCLFDHFWKGADDALPGVVNILQLMDEQIIHRLDVRGEQARVGLPLDLVVEVRQQFARSSARGHWPTSRRRLGSI